MVAPRCIFKYILPVYTSSIVKSRIVSVGGGDLDVLCQ